MEEEVSEVINSNTPSVCIIGGTGSGKSTALRHLAAVFGDQSIEFLDEPRAEVVRSFERRGAPLVYTARYGEDASTPTFSLASWTQDDWIEYLLAKYPGECSTVLQKIGADPHRALLVKPQLGAIVIERLATDSDCPDVASAVLDEVVQQLGQRDAWALGSLYLQASLPGAARRDWHAKLLARTPSFAARREVREIIVAARIVDNVVSGAIRGYWRRPLSRGLVTEIARTLRRRGSTEFDRLLEKPHKRAVAMLASVAVSRSADWQPDGLELRYLNDAHLAAAVWPRVNLVGCRMRNADFRGADLRRANMARCQAPGANFSLARLASADMEFAEFSRTRFRSADLQSITACRASFFDADLANANLDAAKLEHANLAGADLRGASFIAADLMTANFKFCRIDGADLRRADLRGAEFDRLPLRLAKLDGADFSGAWLHRVDLEGVELEAAKFGEADLSNALMTGSRLPEAGLRDADLSGAGLAEVVWRGADLRGADLRGATFHLGSSRSGKVDSTIASEGSRTGFYTDEYHEQEFRAPEDIRKADLRDVDLRGAEIEGVDFYLVDLRGARLDPEQRAHVERTRAIL